MHPILKQLTVFFFNKIDKIMKSDEAALKYSQEVSLIPNPQTATNPKYPKCGTGTKSIKNVDGDSCHHAHKAAKRFCKPFNLQIEMNRYLQICTIFLNGLGIYFRLT